MIHYIAIIENGQIKTLKLPTGDNLAEGLQEDGTTVNIDLPELEGYRVIDAKYSKNILLLILEKKGKYFRYVFFTESS